MNPNPAWLRPGWSVPGVGAFMTTRLGGVSLGPHGSLNLGTQVGDDPAAVARNRQRVAEGCGVEPVYLQQVHGTTVVHLRAADVGATAGAFEADASVTSEAGIACAIQVADCLPVLFAAPGARAVGAAHAGWRGLARGVLEAALQAVCEVGHCAPGEVSAWLGACIGPQKFEVGPDVLQAFGVSPSGASPRFESLGGRKWHADLPGWRATA